MVSRRSTGPLRTILPAVAVGLTALLGAVGCSAGQVTQTDSIEPAVNGNRAQVGDIVLRDVLVAYPAAGDYDSGDDAPLVLTIVNIGGGDDELISVSSPAAGEVELLGDTALPGRAALQVVVPDESTPSSASSATEPEGTESSLPEESITEPSAPGATGTESAESSEPSEPESTESSSPEVTGTELAPQEVGTLSIVLTGLVADLPMGKNVPVTFVFAEAGEVTVNLPIAAPTTPREDPAEGEEEAH